MATGRQEGGIRSYAKTSDGMKLAMSNAIGTAISTFDLQKQPHHPRTSNLIIIYGLIICSIRSYQKIFIDNQKNNRQIET